MCWRSRLGSSPGTEASSRREGGSAVSRRGFWSVYLNYDLDPNSTGAEIQDRRWLSAYAVGGFATYDRRKLRELGGFNTLLAPFHWEDVDLSYRGWKRGWKIHYEPNSVAYHRISATIGSRFRPRKVETVAVRNRLLFHWINLHSTGYWIRHLVGLAGLLLTRFMVLDGNFYRFFPGRSLPDFQSEADAAMGAGPGTAIRCGDLQNTEFLLSDRTDSSVSEQQPGPSGASGSGKSSCRRGRLLSSRPVRLYDLRI